MAAAIRRGSRTMRRKIASPALGFQQASGWTTRAGDTIIGDTIVDHAFVARDALTKVVRRLGHPDPSPVLGRLAGRRYRSSAGTLAHSSASCP
jgi:hypothetical protein